jgi:PAS domain S-box-containing protein
MAQSDPFQEKLHLVSGKNPGALNMLLSEVFENAPASISVFRGPDHEFEYVNEECKRTFGLTNPIGKKLRDVRKSPQSKRNIELFDEVFRTGRPFVGKALPVTGTGNDDVAFFDITITPVQDSSGKVAGIAVFSFDVSDLVRARKRAEGNEASLHLALRMASMGTWEWDLQTKKATWDEGIHRLLGHSSSAASGPEINVFELAVQESDQQRFWAKAEEAIRSGSEFSETFQVKRQDGELRWVNSLGRAIYDSSGVPTKVVGVLADVTDVRVASDAKARLAAIVASSDDAIVGKDLTGKIVSWNQGAERIFGYSSAEIIGKSITVIIPPDRTDDERAILQAVKAGRRIEHFETERIRKDGRRITVSLTVSPIKNEQGIIVGASKIARDVTEKKAAQDALKASEAKLIQSVQAMASNEGRLEDALETGKIGIWELDLTSMNVTRSVGHDALYGYSAPLPSWSYDQFIDALHPEDRERVKEEFGRLLSEQSQMFAGQFRVLWPNGEVHWLLSRARFVRNSSGKPTLLRGTLMEMTELKQTQLRLEDAISARDNFLSIASHELRTPLSALKLQAQLTKRTLSKMSQGENLPNERVQRFAELAETQTDRLTKLVEDMLDVSRISLGKLKLNPEACDLSEMVNGALETMSHQLQEAGCEVITQGMKPVIGVWDKFRMEQVIINLLSNAAKYGARKPVTIAIRSDDDSASLSVTDHGLGIAEEHQRRIFEQYERAVGANNISGLGLGLYISRQIVTAHGGEISVSSRPGAGSTFTVRLPRRSVEL